MTLFIGLDDTDMLHTRGTGRLAREIAAALAQTAPVLGVTRHQLSDDPRVPCTHKNSCAAILLDAPAATATAVLHQVRALMLADFVPGSDPGLCVATAVPRPIIQFGLKTKQTLVTQSEARRLAAVHGVTLLGLGGDEGGVIGALAAVGLAASGEDGRYILTGRVRDLEGAQPVSALLAAGVTAVQTADGQPVNEGLILTEKLRPARRNGRPVAVVQRQGAHWLPLKLD